MQSTIGRRIASRLAAAAIVCLVFHSWSAAQVWIRDERAGIEAARKQNRLLVIFFGHDSSRRAQYHGSRTSINGEGLRRALKDAEIERLISDWFVRVEPNWQPGGALTGDLKIRPGRNEVVIAKADGTVLGRISSPGGRSIDEVAQKVREPIKAALIRARDQKFAEDYEREVRQVLSDPVSKPAELKSALKKALAFHTDSTEADVIAVLERDKLDTGVRQMAYDVLIKLSTPGAVKELMKQAATVPAAEKMINQLDRKAIPPLLDYLKGDPSDDFLRAYYAVVSIARLQSTSKPRKWWSEQGPAARKAEVERIRGIIEKKER